MNFQDFIIDPKDAQRILVGAGGKLAPMEFAQGLAFVTVADLVMGALYVVPVIGMLAGLVMLALAYAWVCLFSKRFHDAGQSGWMTAAAIVAAMVLYGLANVMLTPFTGGMSLFSLNAIQPSGAGFLFGNTISTIIVNGALGVYMYRLKSVMI